MKKILIGLIIVAVIVLIASASKNKQEGISPEGQESASDVQQTENGATAGSDSPASQSENEIGITAQDLENLKTGINSLQTEDLSSPTQ